MNAALFIIFGFFILSMYLGISAKKGKDMNLEQWTVGGRGFGTLFLFLLLAGEIYTTFTFLGASSWAYGNGAPALYVLAYLSLGYVLFYWILPKIWKYAKEHNLLSQSDFYARKYESPYLGVLVAVIGVVSMIPYTVIQLKGLGIIVSEASYGSISPAAAVWIGAITVTVYVMSSGIHGSAWTAVIKDIMILGICIFIGIYLPLHYYGGFQPMFEAIHAANPAFLKLPDKGFGISWFISTVLLTVLGMVAWPHSFSATFSGKSENVFRKNAIVSPLYALLLLFVFFVGFAAIQQVPGLKGPDADLALLKLTIQTFDPWLVGLIGAAGLLTALVPGSMLLMASAATLSKNVYSVFVPTASDQQVAKLAKYLVPVLSLISVYFTFNGGNTIVTLLLMAYSFVTQLVPALLASFMKNQFVTKQGAAAGMSAGVILVAYITITKSTIGTLFPILPQAVKDMNVGIVGLFVNVAMMVVVSLLTRNSAASSNLKDQSQSA
ncbi:sodium:solute symporter family protein [Brevibacillus choshinensis]|uniref:Sodium:solute symporter n=1 Tax=Brevibacillus choshinensis TaxID=54911 RepID=A0ABX7FVY4_BRECH|nr:sodium:solute symporter [Brevibacillus choshinensis]QRG70316.1 sodium:solute symporter [Brevibacillus choshinensis]